MPPPGDKIAVVNVHIAMRRDGFNAEHCIDRQLWRFAKVLQRARRSKSAMGPVGMQPAEPDELGTPI
jgi:hypothetical protein